MRSLFQHRTQDTPQVIETEITVFPQITGAQIAAAFAGKRVGGDFYDAVRVNPERILFGLLDVAGSREDNRGILAAVQEIFRSQGTELFTPVDINESDAMTELCHRLNRTVIEYAHGVRSCPAFIGCYHETFGTLCYTNAGHTSALLRDSSGISELRSTGLPLGLFSHATSDSHIEGMEKGAALLLVSRGLVECGGNNDKSASEFGLNRIKDFLGNAPLSSAQQLCSDILSAAETFSAVTPMCNDRTALALVRNP